jgi:hypothetical protein
VEGKEMTYMHKETGTIDDRAGWIASYTAEELQERRLTAEQAFREDVGSTLFAVAPEYCTQNAGDCESCSLVNYGRDCMNNPIGTERK